jgi:hypothetical protein
MQPVLVEIAQHQPAGKQPIENNAPAECRGKLSLTVQQDEFVGLRAKQRNIDGAEGAAAVNRPVTLGPPLDETLRVGQEQERVTDDRPAVVAGDVR